MTTIRRTASCAMFLPLSLILAIPAQAQQEYPSRPIRLITPAAAGGTTDILARTSGALVADNLECLVGNESYDA